MRKRTARDRNRYCCMAAKLTISAFWIVVYSNVKSYDTVPTSMIISLSPKYCHYPIHSWAEMNTNKLIDQGPEERYASQLACLFVSPESDLRTHWQARTRNRSHINKRNCSFVPRAHDYPLHSPAMHPLPSPREPHHHRPLSRIVLTWKSLRCSFP